jgi:hypothetical protein
MDKSKIEEIARRSGMVPVSRTNIDGAEVFIADGFSSPDLIETRFKRFGITKDDFPGGCFATLWWISRQEDKLDIGQPLFFELFHDRTMSSEGKKYARINSATNAAKDFLDSRKKVRH